MTVAAKRDDQAVALALGCCILKVQGLELALKSLLAKHHLTLRGATLQGAAVSGKTLGGLAELVTGSLLRPESEAQEMEVPGNATVAVRFRISLPDEQFHRLGQDLAALVATRNRIVHHLAEDHDLTAPEGRRSALAALECLSARADALREEVALWARDQAQLQNALASFLSDPSYMDLFLGKSSP